MTIVEQDIPNESMVEHNPCPYANRETLRKDKYFIAYDVIPPRNSQEGYSVPESHFHLVGVRLKGKISKGYYHIGDHKWRNIQYEKETIHMAEATQNGLGWQWEEKDIIEDLEKVVILLSPKKLNMTAQDLFDMDEKNIEIPTQVAVKDPLIVQLAYALQQQVIRNNKPCPMYSNAVMHMLSVQLLTNYNIVKKTLKEYKQGLSKQSLSLVLEYINAYYHRDILLEDLSALCNLSVYHFARQFKRSTGYTPRQYVLSLRIEKAKELLQTTTLSVEKVAESVGYENASSFYRMFKKITNTSPKKFKK